MFTFSYSGQRETKPQCEQKLTLHEVQHEDTRGDGLGGHLDPPLEEEGEQQHPDQTLPSQSRPGTLWFGFAER